MPSRPIWMKDNVAPYAAVTNQLSVNCERCFTDVIRSFPRGGSENTLRNYLQLRGVIFGWGIIVRCWLLGASQLQPPWRWCAKCPERWQGDRVTMRSIDWKGEESVVTRILPFEPTVNVATWPTRCTALTLWRAGLVNRRHACPEGQARRLCVARHDDDDEIKTDYSSNKIIQISRYSVA